MAVSPEDRFVEAGGIRLHVADWGGEGPPAVLLHATGFHARLWDPVARALASRFHVYAPDARGHGDSEKPEGGYDWSVFVDDTIALLDALGVRDALGIGHSMGATTAAAAAAARPDLYGRLVLLDPILFPREGRTRETSENPLAVAARKRREVWPGVRALFESYRPRPPFDTWTDETLRLYVEHGTEPAGDGAVRLKCPGRIEAQVFSMAGQFDAWAALDRVEAPTLLVRGERTGSLSPADARRALGHLRHGRLLTAPDTTHFVPMERPDWVVETVLGFLDDRDPEPVLPAATRGLAHVALNVGRLEETRAFYEDVFGMRVVWQPDADNVYLSGGRDNLALHRARGGVSPGPGALDHVGFLVERPAAVYAAAEALRRRGIPLWKEPRRHRDGSCSLYLKDPDGNVVQILYTPDADLD